MIQKPFTTIIYTTCIILYTTLYSVTSTIAETQLKKYPISIVTHNGNIHFQVEFARKTKQKRLGLMYRQSLDDNSGMLFFFTPPRVVTMWMKNTFIPLDMIFIDKNNQIVHIVSNTIPQNLTPISSIKRVHMVLEVKAGTVNLHHIKIGDKVIVPS